MELPIRLIITFFVVVAVSTAIITLSRNIMTKADTDLKHMGPLNENKEEQKIISLSSFSDDQIASLAVECFNQNYGRSLVDELCFSVHDDSGSGGLDTGNIDSRIRNRLEGVSLDIDFGIDSSTYALRIYYLPASTTLLITK